MNARKLILVIDDSATIREGVRGALAEKGYEVLTAQDPVQGLMIARDKQPQLIVLDIQMPGGGGSTLYERLKSLDLTSQIAVVLYSALTPIEIEQMTMLPPEATLVSKTEGFQSLAERIHQLLG